MRWQDAERGTPRCVGCGEGAMFRAYIPTGRWEREQCSECGYSWDGEEYEVHDAVWRCSECKREVKA